MFENLQEKHIDVSWTFENTGEDSAVPCSLLRKISAVFDIKMPRKLRTCQLKRQIVFFWDSEDKIAIRRLFNRSVEMNHRTKKIQTLFKKYLTYELNQTDSHKDLVKEKARAFLQRQENLD